MRLKHHLEQQGEVPAVQASMRKYWTVIGFFASATPVGILLGVLLSSVSNSDAAAAVSALASGMLLPPMGLPALCDMLT